jgi:hypothetical protein
MRSSIRLLSLCASAFAAFGTFTIISTQPASAHGSYATTWSGRYPTSTTLTKVTAGTGQSCALCHFAVGGGSNWNAYGWKMRQGTQAGQSVLNAIINAENFNSDADPTTSSNVFEIGANSQPGWTPGAVNTEYFTSSTTPNLSPPAAIQPTLDPTVAVPFCFGDGSSVACPCGNVGLAGRGCANSNAGSTGGLLAASGTASVGADSLVLTASDITGPALFYQGTGTSDIAFGDGKLCAAVGIIRMGIVFPTGVTASYPGGLTPNPISIAGLVPAGGGVRYYQAWYRDAVSFCTASTFNLTNALALTWVP